MEPLENNLDVNFDFKNNELSTETPVGWSSTCLDQTIHYYIDWNSIHLDDAKNLEIIDKN